MPVVLTVGMRGAGRPQINPREKFRLRCSLSAPRVGSWERVELSRGEGAGSKERRGRGARKRRGLTQRREDADRGARGDLIEVSTFKVAKTRGLPRTDDIIYLFTPHSITAAWPQNWLPCRAVCPRDRDSRRYLHANSHQTRFLSARGRIRAVTNRDRAPSCRVRTGYVDMRTRFPVRIRSVVSPSPLSVTFDPRFDPRFTPTSLSSSRRRSLRLPCHSLLPATPTVLGHVTQSRLLELLTLNPLLHIAAVEFNLVVHSHCFRTWNWIPGVNSRDFWACQPTSRWTGECTERTSLVRANIHVVFDACVRVNKHRRAVNRACATRRIVIDKQPCAGFKKRSRRVYTLSGVMKYRWVFDFLIFCRAAVD